MKYKVSRKELVKKLEDLMLNIDMMNDDLYEVSLNETSEKLQDIIFECYDIVKGAKETV